MRANFSIALDSDKAPATSSATFSKDCNSGSDIKLIETTTLYRQVQLHKVYWFLNLEKINSH